MNFLAIPTRAISLLSLLSSLLTSVPLVNSESSGILFYFANSPLGHRLGVWPLALSLAHKDHQIVFISSHAKQIVKDPRIEEVSVKKARQDFGPLIYEGIDILTEFRAKGRIQSLWDANALNALFVCEAILRQWDSLVNKVSR
jgi:hypothetical protein